MNTWVAVFLGGGCGSVARYGISRLLIALPVRSVFPWATLVVNVLSALMLGWALLRMQPYFQQRPAAAAFVAIGFCGGFSTFSAFSHENFLLYRDGMPGMALLNIAVSVLACMAVFFLIARST